MARYLVTLKAVNDPRRLQPGRVVRFLITDSDSREGIPEELLHENQRYDAAKYLESLVSAATAVLEPFGYDKRELVSYLRASHVRRRDR